MSSATASATASPFMVRVSLTFIVVTMVSSAMLAFSVGQIARQMIMNDGDILSTAMNSNTLNMVPSSYNTIEDNNTNDHPAVLPHPKLANGKRVPSTIYTSKNYNTGRSVTSDSLLARKDKDEWVVPGDALRDEANASPDNKDHVKEEEEEEDDDDEEDDEEDEEIHEPSGQHLLIDIEHIDAMFLNSKELLAQAMIELVDLSGLTLLSYHCHGLEPMGVSCAGVLLESHVSFHTWPIPGVITLDLFTCGPKSLVPLVPLIKNLFAIPQEDSDLEPHMLWSFKRRGFRDNEGVDAGASDLHNMLLGVMEFEEKKQIASVQTDFQTIDIYDIVHPRFNDIKQYKKSLSGDDSYESKNRELYQPDRIIYLDGVMQSRRYGDAGYHEALVHPAMLAVPEPKTAVIIGGGEGATLREVLKHKTITKAIMVEIDEQMVSVSREHLPEWSDCSDFLPGIQSCFDDPRVEVIFSDAVQWFIDNFSKDIGGRESKYGEVDLIIMDALDPGDNVKFSDILFNNAAFAESLFNSLSDAGAFICQTGSAVDMDEAPALGTRFGHDFIFKERLENAGFESIVEYEAPHGGFMSPWSFFVAFADSDSKRYWHQNEAEINLEIRKRVHSKIISHTTSYQSTMSLKYFDGSTMQSYHFPSRPVEVAFCRSFPNKFGCSEEGNSHLLVKHGFDPNILDVSIDKFEVQERSSENAGRTIFTTIDVPKGSYIAAGEGSRNIHVNPTTYSLLHEFTNAYKNSVVQDDRWSLFDPLLNGYGFADSFFGGEARSVDVGIAKVMNHGCDVSLKKVSDSDTAEMIANDSDTNKKRAWEDEVHNPFRDRSARILKHTDNGARYDVAAGEEIMDNFFGRAPTDEMRCRVVLH